MPDDLSNKNREMWTKIMFGVLVFFGISTLILGVLRIGRTISNPIGGYGAGEVSELDFSVSLDEMQRTLEEMRLSDTDGDGLSDFDEMYIYSTSMYLVDSDSDGYDDKLEIEGGYDPNCPKGMDCRRAASSGDETPDGTTDSPGGDELQDEAKDQLSNLTPDEIRQLLLASGQISAEELDKIDDATLMSVMEEILNQ